MTIYILELIYTKLNKIIKINLIKFEKINLI